MPTPVETVMALDFTWNPKSKSWTVAKSRRKRAWHEHKGVAYYDKQRRNKPLDPMLADSRWSEKDYDGQYTRPPSWLGLPESWGDWKNLGPGGYDTTDFWNQDAPDNETTSIDDEPIIQAEDCYLQRCFVQKRVYVKTEYVVSGKKHLYATATYLWELVFDNATFRFVSKSVALAALTEIRKIRKAKHKPPKYSCWNTSPLFFTDRRLRKLPADKASE